MLRAEVHVGLGWVAAISLVLMAVIFGSVMSHGRHMLFGERAEGETAHPSPSNVTVPLIGALAACGALGVVAWPLDSLLRAAAMVVVK
jgi:formate hydrogenlyase subunit 3/multisubunit Na+/H+ antiporter MnhD subunit